MTASQWVVLGVLVSMLAIAAPGVRAGSDETAAAKKFLDDFTAKLRPIETEANRAWWDANISGKEAEAMAGMAEKSREFLDKGGALYVDAAE